MAWYGVFLLEKKISTKLDFYLIDLKNLGSYGTYIFENQEKLIKQYI